MNLDNLSHLNRPLNEPSPEGQPSTNESSTGATSNPNGLRAELPTFQDEEGNLKPVKDPNDGAKAALQAGRDFRTETLERIEEAELERPPGWASVQDLVDLYHRQQREPVIEGLLRKGEVMTMVAPPKTGKSWLAYNLALAVCSGTHFLWENWKCKPGRVAILDNELHDETIGYRIPHMIDVMGLPDELRKKIWCRRYRGDWKDLNQIKQDIVMLRAFAPRIIILDSLYRFYGDDFDENSNADMARICNTIDTYAKLLDTSIVLIHHNAKGCQASKAITEVGAGGGALVRGIDAHLIMREHDEADHFVLEAACRTWGQPQKMVMKWEYPLFRYKADMDPNKLKGMTPERTKSKVSVEDLVGQEEALTLCLDDDWMQAGTLQTKLCERHGCTPGVAAGFVKRLKAKHRLYEMDDVDGLRDCGTFLVQKVRGWIQFKKK